MDWFRSRRMTAIGAASVLALAATGIVVGAQIATGQDSGDGGPTGVQYAQVRGDLGEGPRPQSDMHSDSPAMQDRDRPPGGGPATAIAVGEGAVFVVAHGTLYRFDSRSLALEGRQRIPGGALSELPAGAGIGEAPPGGLGAQESPGGGQPGAPAAPRGVLRRIPPR